MSQKKVVILIGPPGAGKGTQGMLLSEKMRLYYFETSKILEESFENPNENAFLEVEGKKYLFKDEKEIWKKGLLCSPPFVAELVKGRIRQLHERGESILLSGSPRTLHEGEQLMPILEELYGKENIKIVLLDISPEQTMFRNSNRRICELMRHSILYTEETKTLTKCPLDGSDLIRRKGLDDPDTIPKRLEQYKERTVPLLELFEKRGLKVNKVNGEGSVNDVFERNVKALG